MSYKIVREVLEHSRSERSARQVLLVLAERAASDRRVHPKIKTLVRETKLARSTVTAALKDLEEQLGEIRCDGRLGGRGGGPKVWIIDPRPLHVRLGKEPQASLFDTPEEVRSSDQSGAGRGPGIGPHWSGDRTSLSNDEPSMNHGGGGDARELAGVVGILRRRSWLVNDQQIEIVMRRCTDTGCDPVAVAEDALILADGNDHWRSAARAYQQALDNRRHVNGQAQQLRAAMTGPRSESKDEARRRRTDDRMRRARA